jgi:hypothetical protein
MHIFLLKTDNISTCFSTLLAFLDRGKLVTLVYASITYFCTYVAALRMFTSS